MERPLVSILSPCWNGTEYVGRMSESILSQSWSNIEMICIDDGSTDNTSAVILSYAPRFQKRGMALKCLRQSNQGAAAAIDYGLKHITGEYLCWIDCDDFLSPNSVEKKLVYLLKNPQYSIVTSDLFITDEREPEKVLSRRGTSYRNLNYQPNQFYLALTGCSLIEPLAHMIRVKDLRKINPEMRIPKCKEGQNLQMLLPMYYHFQRGFIDEPLGYYVVRKDSHYHQERSREEWLRRFDALLEMLRELFEQMGLPQWEIEKYIKLSTFFAEKEQLLVL